MVDAVLSYHLDANTCGVARFNQALARRLGVPCLSLERHPHILPLVSVKTGEIPSEEGEAYDVAMDVLWYRTFDLFLHGRPSSTWDEVVSKARRVFVADSTIKARRDQVIGFCPSTIAGEASRGAYRVLTFGMVHKKLAPHFSQLKHRLDTEHPDYTIELSAAQHEGKTETIEDAAKELRAIFGDKLRVLGNLSDDALAKELRDVNAVALYYDPALRANNTTAWAALEAGKTLYTNTDEHSPPLDPKLHSWEMLCALLKGAA